MKEHDAPEEDEENVLRQRKVGASTTKDTAQDKSPKPEEKLERQR